MYRFIRVLVFVLFPVSLTLAQTVVDLGTQSKNVDFSAANTTKPFKSGPILPAICSVGEMFYKTDAPPGSNLYGCTALNSWTLQSVDPAVMTLRRVTAVSDAPTISPNTGTTDLLIQSNTQAAGTLTINNLTGTPSDGQTLIVRIKSATIQTLSFGSAYRGGNDLALLAATTGAGKTDYLKFMWDATDSTWDFVAKTAGF